MTFNFHSILELVNNDLGDDVHMLWALSKDFGASGFREVGVLCTQNEFVASTVMGHLNIFTEVSFPMQAVVANLLADVCGRISCFLVKGFLGGGDELLDRDNHSRGIAHLICSCSTSGYICLL
jgi:hypothetical protein